MDKENTRPTRGEIREHPAVKDVLGILGGRLVEVKPIGKKSKEEA